MSEVQKHAQELVEKMLPGVGVTAAVSRAVGQPNKRRIHISVQVNASVDFLDDEGPLTVHDAVEVRTRQAVDDLKEQMLLAAQGPKPKPKLPRLGDAIERGCCK